MKKVKPLLLIKNNPRYDGANGIEFPTNNINRTKSFGDHSNGGSGNSSFNIMIEKDTIIIKEIID